VNGGAGGAGAAGLGGGGASIGAVSAIGSADVAGWAGRGGSIATVFTNGGAGTAGQRGQGASVETVTSSSVAGTVGRGGEVASVQDDEDGYSGGGHVDGDADEEEITVEVVEMLRPAATAAQNGDWTVFDYLLGKSPHLIQDVFSSCLGDVFHFMDRPKVPVHHELKKASSVRYRRFGSHGILLL